MHRAPDFWLRFIGAGSAPGPAVDPPTRSRTRMPTIRLVPIVKRCAPFKKMVFLIRPLALGLTEEAAFLHHSHYFPAASRPAVEQLRTAYLREINSQGNDSSHVTSRQHSQRQQADGDEIIHSALLYAPTTAGLQIFSGFHGFLRARRDSKRRRGTFQFFRPPCRRRCSRSAFLLSVPGNSPCGLTVASEKTFSNLRSPAPEFSDSSPWIPVR